MHGGASPSGGCLIVGPMTTPEWPPEKELCRQSPSRGIGCPEDGEPIASEDPGVTLRGGCRTVFIL